MSFERLLARLEPISDAARIVETLRMVKSPAEIEKIARPPPPSTSEWPRALRA